MIKSFLHQIIVTSAIFLSFANQAAATGPTIMGREESDVASENGRVVCYEFLLPTEEQTNFHNPDEHVFGLALKFLDEELGVTTITTPNLAFHKIIAQCTATSTSLDCTEFDHACPFSIEGKHYKPESEGDITLSLTYAKGKGAMTLPGSINLSIPDSHPNSLLKSVTLTPVTPSEPIFLSPSIDVETGDRGIFNIVALNVSRCLLTLNLKE